MKKNLLALSLLLGAISAYGTDPFTPSTSDENIVLNCEVPTEDGSGPKVYLTIDKDVSIDFIRIYLLDEVPKQEIYFNQLKKGGFQASLKSGMIEFPARSENNKIDRGVLRGAGYFLLQKNAEDESLQGALIIKSNIYPIVCSENNSTNLQNTINWRKMILDLKRNSFSPFGKP